ncbi:MAG TPA: M20/M25/M40 family metallo-hydrolase [Gemmatimonadales bacterium]|nr:M20/M25/M40 family metallo-hydrolase [Gemmatimonadales bacterium]
MRHSSLLILPLALAVPLAAQSPAPAAPSALGAAAATITPADVARRVGVIAHDSMMGRDTPSPGLEKTARYLADEFRRFGLKPGGENGTWFQRYTIARRRLDAGASRITFVAGGARSAARFDRDAALTFGGAPARPVAGTPYLLAGALDPARIDRSALKGRLLLVVLDYAKPRPPAAQQALGVALQTGVRGIVLISNRDSAELAERLARQSQPQLSVGSRDDLVPVVEVHERAIRPALGAAGLDPARLRAADSMVARVVEGLTVELALRAEVLDSASAPNTIGILEGSDPELKHEYVVYSAHMDHVGIAPGRPDSIYNGADDDASGTAGLVELAEAFAQPGARPKRSILFVGVSGEEKGLWGSAHFAEHPTVPLRSMVANINMDMIGRNWKDTIVAIGKEHSDLGATLERVNAAHPELRMTAIDDRWPEENFYYRSDHFNFARKGVPILFFFNGVHPDYHQPSDSPEKIDAEKEARILRLLFYLGQEIGNAPERPKWNPESYRRIVEGAEAS